MPVHKLCSTFNIVSFFAWSANAPESHIISHGYMELVIDVSFEIMQQVR